MENTLQTRCARIKLKTGCVDESRQWFQTIMDQKDEALKILKEQGVYVEAAFLDKLGEDYYLIYFMKEKNSKHSAQIASQSQHPLNEGHRLYKNKCWDEKVTLEVLLDLDRILSD